VKPPDAIVVDVVPPNEAPRLEGRPSDAPTSGSDSPIESHSASAAPAPPLRKPAAQSPQQLAMPQREVRQSTARPQSAEAEMEQAQMALTLVAQAETARASTAQPDPAQPEMAKIRPPPSPLQPLPGETPDQAAAADRLAQLALLGGQRGGGFGAPAVDAPDAAHDFTVAFRERVSSCSSTPAGVNVGDKIAISVRVSFNPDGSLASPPQLNGAGASQKEQALLQGAIHALEKCQPYTMLPAERYKEWRTLDLTFSPMNFPAR
jgi:hypothetical protein